MSDIVEWDGGGDNLETAHREAAVTGPARLRRVKEARGMAHRAVRVALERDTTPTELERRKPVNTHHRHPSLEALNTTGG